MFFKHMYIYLKYATISICNVSCFYYNIQVSFINNKKEIFFLSILFMHFSNQFFNCVLYCK